MDSFKPGDTIIGKYELTAPLGKGGMGLVFAARHLDLGGELVALKFLLPHLRANPELSARFAREARTGIRIKNEHVARVYDVGTVDGTPFMVMEHLIGQDLSSVIAERGQLPIAESVELLLQACEALAEAHRLGIVHRDLKPANLFVSPPDEMPFVRVLDFGISKWISEDDVSMTASAAVLGSPRYMSPEQLSSTRSVDSRSDIWSLGVILYEMLSGRTPFTGESFPEICASILGGKYAKVSTLRPDVPPALERALDETLTLDRDARLSTVEAFAARIAPFGSEAALLSYQRVQRISALPPPPRVSEVASVRPPGAKASAAVDTTGASLPQPTALAARAEPEQRPTRWPRTLLLAAAGGAALVGSTLLLSRSGASSRSAIPAEDETLAAPAAPASASAAPVAANAAAISVAPPSRPAPEAGAPPPHPNAAVSSAPSPPVPHRDRPVASASPAASTRSHDELFNSQE